MNLESQIEITERQADMRRKLVEKGWTLRSTCSTWSAG